MDLIVTDLSGNTEMLTDFQKLQRTRKVNDEHSITFILFQTDRNQYAYDLVIEESTLEYDSESYVIKKITENTIGKIPVKQVTALRDYFSLIDIYQYDTTSGSLSITQALDFALNGTGYTFALIDTVFSNVEYQSLGNDNALALLNKVLTDYQAEIEVVGTVINIYGQIGNNSDFQFRYNHNVQTIAKSIDSSNLSTYIKGYGKQNTDGTYVCTADYTSPNSSIYGIRHAPPIQDDRFTDVSSLTDYLKKSLQDEPNISFTLTFAELKKAGYPWEVIGEGDTVYVIHEPLNIDITARVMEYIDFPESNDQPQVTLANFKNNLTDIVTGLGQTEKTVKNVLNDSGKIKFDVLDDAVKIATQALNNSMTELEYPTNGGIIARDKNNSNNYLILNSAGLGLTTDGGKTYNYAITANGINADLITVGTLLFDMLKGGTLTLGGLSNQNGVLIVNNSNGETIATLDGNQGGFDTLSVTKLISNSVTSLNLEDQSYSAGSGGIQPILDSLPLYNQGNITITLTANTTETVDISGYSGQGTLTIDFAGFTLTGSVNVQGNTNKITVQNGSITSSDSNVVYIADCTQVEVGSMNLNGNNSSINGVKVDSGGNAYVHDSTMNNMTYSGVEVAAGGVAYLVNNQGSGSNMSHGYSNIGGVMTGTGTTPTGTGNAVVTSDGGYTGAAFSTSSTGTTQTATTQPTTTTWTSSSANDYSNSGYWDNSNQAKQGNWGYGRRTGLFFFPSSMASTLSGKTISAMSVYLERPSTGGDSGDVTIYVRTHNYSSTPSGAPTVDTSNDVTIALPWGGSGWVNLPSAMFNQFSSGSAKGIGLYVASDSSSEYAVFNGTNCKVKATYK